MLREELQLLHEPGSHVGEVIKVISNKLILIKVSYFILLFYYSYYY